MLKYWAPRILMSVATAWLIVIAGAGMVYIQAMLHPGCPASPDQRPGYQSVSLVTADGLTLRGWWRPPQNGAVILLMAGHGGGRDSMLPEAETLAAGGFGALLVDGRQCAGGLVTFGAREADDLAAMLAFARAQPGVRWVGALGFSAGGTAVLIGSARLPEIRAVLAEGNYANLQDEMLAAGAYLPALEWQLHHSALLSYALVTGIWPGTVSPVDALPRLAPRPVLLIHGALEIQRSQGERQYAAAGEPRELWVVPGAQHGTYLYAAPREYPCRILAFFQQAYRQDINR